MPLRHTRLHELFYSRKPSLCPRDYKLKYIFLGGQEGNYSLIFRQRTSSCRITPFHLHPCDHQKRFPQ